MKLSFRFTHLSSERYFRDPVNSWEVKGYTKVSSFSPAHSITRAPQPQPRTDLLACMQLVTHPMDLRTILEKLDTHDYKCGQVSGMEPRCVICDVCACVCVCVCDVCVCV
jgi:hypothetical protein